MLYQRLKNLALPKGLPNSRFIKESESLQVELARKEDLDVISYLEADISRNALDIWNLQLSEKRQEMYVCRDSGRVKSHISIYNTPEGIYTNIGGEVEAAKELFALIPKRTVVTVPMTLGGLIQNILKFDATYKNDLMVVERGAERLRSYEQAKRLSLSDEVEYSSFGTSFNLPQVQSEWIREQLDRNFIFGAFEGGKLASVSSLVAWLPRIAVIMGVETKPEFRRRGLASISVSAAVKEGLKLSQSCTLFVRSENVPAIALYGALGFEKTGEELWIDIGTGMIP